jgi:glutamyl-tRNA reductase
MAAFEALAQMKNDEEIGRVRLQLRNIAQSEITRQRKRLASLTSEQQSAVEALLISTADLISHQLIDRIHSRSEGVRQKSIKVISDAFAAWPVAGNLTQGVS